MNTFPLTNVLLGLFTWRHTVIILRIKQLQGNKTTVDIKSFLRYENRLWSPGTRWKYKEGKEFMKIKLSMELQLHDEWQEHSIDIFLTVLLSHKK